MSWKTHLLQSTNTYFHIYNRGVDRGSLFFGNADFEFFLAQMADAQSQTDIVLLAYALLPNHFHLIAKQQEEYAVSSFMQKVCWKYSHYVNHKRPRTGHLFEGRFKIQVIRDDASLLRVSHYVHWNPVSAGLTQSPSAWRYCSFKEYADGLTTSLLATDELASLVGSREEYSQFLLDYDPSQPGSVIRYLKTG